MSVKECGHYEDRRRIIFRRIFAGLLIFLFLVLLTILLIWAILQPKKPRFIIQDATLYAFNTSSNPNLLTSNFQVTISSHNPNDKIGIYYDKLDIYASYHDQQITLRTTMPTNYQGHHEVNVFSPFVYGNAVPVAPYNTMALKDDQERGTIMLMIKIDGRVRWKVGAFISGRYHLYVRCPAIIQFGSRSNSFVVSENVIKYQLVQRCSVSV